VNEAVLGAEEFRGDNQRGELRLRKGAVEVSETRLIEISV
jgi:hypothetical protein